MSTIEIKEPAALGAALETLQPGDCLLAESFSALARSVGELLKLAEAVEKKQAVLVSRAEGVDTADDGGFFFRVCAGLAGLEGTQRRREGVERAKADGRYKGRKPIAVDEALFDETVARWEQGEITAREAMRSLALKPNTFYRRIKEREETKMKEYKQVEKEIRQELRETSRQSKKAMDDLRKQVRAEAKELKKTAEEKLDLRDVERELRRDRRNAEAEYKDELRQMKKDVENETAELKKLLEGEE